MDCSTDTNARPDPRTEAVRPSGLGTAVEPLQVSRGCVRGVRGGLYFYNYYLCRSYYSFSFPSYFYAETETEAEAETEWREGGGRVG